jgi:predicted RNA-binding protein with PUA domain
MKRTVVISKSHIEQEFKRIKDKFYGKLITNKVDQAFVLKNYFNVERMYVNDTLDENRNGKSIYIVFSDGKEEQVSVSQILKQK